MLSNRYSKRQIKKKNYRSKLRGGTPTTEQKIAARKKKEDEARKIEQDKIDQRREQELRKEQERETERQEFKAKQVQAKEQAEMDREFRERRLFQPNPYEKRFVKLSNDLYSLEGWLDEYKSGNAVVTFKDGTIYNGKLLNGRKHGKGTYLGVDGLETTGSFFMDKASGFCIHKHPCKNEDGSPNGKFEYYRGNYANDKYDGEGKLTDCDGQVYIGDFKNHKKNGFGKQNYLNGSIYEGEWKDDKKHGVGKLTEGDTVIHEGRWENDNAVSK